MRLHSNTVAFIQSYKWLRPLLVVSAFVLLGYLLINSGSDGSCVRTAEAESGILAGNANQEVDAAASGNPAVQFSKQQADLSRLVFATYMPGMAAYGKEVENFREEIREAKTDGFDGFAVSVPGWTDEPIWQTRTQKIFEAAEQEDQFFKLFMMPDFSGPAPGMPAADVVDMVSRFASHPNYYKYQGKPVLTTFIGQNNGEAYWRDDVLDVLKAKGIDPLFLPQAPVTYKGTRMNSWPSWAESLTEGHMFWAAVGTPEELAAIGEDIAGNLGAKNKLFMSGFSPYFWRAREARPGDNRYYYEHRGGEGLAVQWDSIIRKQRPLWVIGVTWNDYTESYISPVDTTDRVKAPVPNFNIRDLLKPHYGYTELNKYYINWYKSGTPPPITQDKLFYFYRVHPKDLVASNDIADIDLRTAVEDELYLTTMLTAPARLQVSTGGRQTAYDVPAGLQHTRVPFLPGEQSFNLTRNGKTILQGEGEPVLNQIEKYNFIPTTGVLTAQ